MYCWKCGKEVPQDASFCPFCGTELKQGSAAPQAAPADAAPVAEKAAGPAPIQSTPVQTGTQPAAPAQSEKKGGKWGTILLGVLMIIFGIVNQKDMAAGGSYLVWFGVVPVQYILIPVGVLCLIAGLFGSNKKKE